MNAVDIMVRKAESMAKMLETRALAAERDGKIAEETVRELSAEGLFSLVKPASCGGKELGLTAVSKVCAALGKGCASTGWVGCVYNVHHWVAAMYPKQAQEEYFGQDDVLSSASFAPSGAAVTTEDGFYATGRWSFASGVDYADWCFLTAMVKEPHSGKPPGPYFLMVPAGDYHIDHDSWQVSGLRATGSKDVVLDETFVPIHRACFMPSLLMGSSPGSRIHQGALYRVPGHPLLVAVLATPVLGAVQRAVELFRDGIVDRRFSHTGQRQAEQPAAKVALAEADACMTTAQVLLENTFVAIEKLVPETSPLQQAQIPRDTAFAMQLLARAIDIVFENVGGAALQESNPIQRIWRDVHAAKAHAAVNWNTQALAWGELRLDDAN
ncbi:MAG: acyl-CoA dehydrogenase family protein [Pseudomonadales bacterium]